MHTGREGTVQIGANTIAEIKSWSIDESAETYGSNEATIGDPAPALTFDVGASSWTASIECLWDETDTTGQGAMTIGASVTVTFYPEGETSGDVTRSGTALITGKGQSASFDGNIIQSFSLQGTGALTDSTVT